MNKEILIERVNADAQALQGVRFVAGKLLNQISEIRRAGKDTSAASAAYENLCRRAQVLNESLLQAGRKLWAAGIDPVAHRDQSTSIFSNFHTTQFSGGHKK